MGLGLSRIVSCDNQLRDLTLTRLFCTIHAFLYHLEAHEVHTETILLGRPFQHQLQKLRKSHHYHLFLLELVDA